MADDIETIIDKATGEVRRLGSLCPPEGFVSSFQTFESEHPVWTDEEIRRVITDPNRTPRRQVFGPSSIQNQRSHGSCNGYAIAGALARARYFRGIQDRLLLSGAFIYALMNSGRDQGSMLESGLKLVQSHGICPEALVPWNQIFPHLQPRNAAEEAKKHKGLACWAVQTKQGFRTALAAGFPVIVAVSAGRMFQTLNPHGIAGVDSGRGNHAIHCDDIAIVNGVEVYDSVNSWGTTYGQQGRAYLTWNSFAQTFNSHVFYAVGSTEEAD